LLQSGQALGIMTVAGKLSNANAIFVGVRSYCLLPSQRNNFVEEKQISVQAIVKGTRRTCVVTVQCSQLRYIRTFRRCFPVFAVLIVANVMARAWAMYQAHDSHRHFVFISWTCHNSWEGKVSGAARMRPKRPCPPKQTC